MSASRLIATARSAARITRSPPGSYTAAAATRHLHTSRLNGSDKSSKNENPIDSLAGGSAKGVTGGGKPLGSSSKHAPPQPKISNQSVPGNMDESEMTEEQRREVEEHNREFDARHDRGPAAEDDKVDKKFWSGDR
ncbi:hypothetical protein B0J13DRAFT_620612 [Dactylonectria estremocensis]|uniref:Succinate dehydrogenase assembly factor 4, mitochondrial n=1 Tax=Dactylonectria estremocensis TaxID=1079267 RepID=A0A9P9F2B8_9HYPO|nr:hypothetical protein B0J13DRAFT_620612 [Dactylonectria estremocensis]